METLWQIELAETNRRKSRRRVRKLKESIAPVDIEKGALNPASFAKCIASVVG